MTQEVRSMDEAIDVVEQFRSYLESLNSSPSPVGAIAPAEGIEAQATPAPAAQRRLLDLDEMFEFKQQLRSLPTNAVYHAFSKQARRADTAVPLDAWLAAGGTIGLTEHLRKEPQLQKMLDTVGGAALVRQDLEPIMYELFVRTFPAFDRIAKEPSNGLVHTYTQQTGVGGAEFMSELGTVSDDAGAYHRETTNIAVIATRRGVTLKQQFGTLQSGSGFNPEQLELRSALIAINAKMQKTIFQGNAEATESGGTDATEAGAFDELGFTGLRQLLDTASAVNADPFAGTPDDLIDKFDEACVDIGDSGGMASVVYISMNNKHLFDKQQDKNVRWMGELVDVAVGMRTQAFNSPFGALPLVPVPGPSIGTYAITGPETVGDAYIVDEATLSLPWLGSEGPTVIEIPTGVSGQLTRLFIVFGMWGLALKAPAFSNKVRIHQS